MSMKSPHRRRNLLSGEWVVVSPHRSKQPRQGERSNPAKVDRPSYQPDCYLCPGNKRQGGIANPQYSGTYIFPNDFPALTQDDKSGHNSDGWHGVPHSPDVGRTANVGGGSCNVVR